MPIIIRDLNAKLIMACRDAGLEVQYGDYFSHNVPNAVLMTASNPRWTFGGGIDAKFAGRTADYSPLPNDYYDILPLLCAEKRAKGGGMERIGDVVFCITVDENLDATKEIVEEAIRFAISQLKEGETLLVHGAGTGRGKLEIEEFVEIMKKLTKNI